MYYLLAIMLTVPTTVEFIRIKLGKKIYGLREHEVGTVASYYWFITGAVVLIAVFPQIIAAPVIIAVSIGDPIIGETRHLRRRYWMTISVLTCLTIYFVFQYPYYLAIPAGIVTFFAESIEFEIHWHLRDSLFRSRSRGTLSPLHKRFRLLFKFDDDLIMLLVPALFLLVLFNIIPWAFPHPIFYPSLNEFP